MSKILDNSLEEKTKEEGKNEEKEFQIIVTFNLG